MMHRDPNPTGLLEIIILEFPRCKLRKVVDNSKNWIYLDLPYSYHFSLEIWLMIYLAI